MAGIGLLVVDKNQAVSGKLLNKLVKYFRRYLKKANIVQNYLSFQRKFNIEDVSVLGFSVRYSPSYSTQFYEKINRIPKV